MFDRCINHSAIGELLDSDEALLDDFLGVKRRYAGINAPNDTEACNMKKVGCGCGSASPRLLRVQDPFAKLLAKARGSMVISYGEIAGSAEVAT